jgi:hypothetical protein
MLTAHTETLADGATPPVEGAPRANRSPEELEMRAALIPWGRARWPGARVLEVFSVGGCRVDLAFVQASHIAAVEIKSSRDTLDRLTRQIEDFSGAIPEIWVATAPKWIGPLHDREHPGYVNLPWAVGHVVVEAGVVSERIKYAHWEMPHSATVDEILTAPMLHLCHRAEMMAIAAAKGLTHKPRAPRRDLMRLLARGLTGDEIVAGACEQLRARVRGWPGDEPLNATGRP